MLFNSITFLFVFAPISLLGYYLIGRLSQTGSQLWLCVASLVFYGWWNVTYVPVIVISVIVNYFISLLIIRDKTRGMLIAGLIFNLGLLFSFKYLSHLVNALHHWGAFDLTMNNIALPLGISFYTFTQIGFLLDCQGGMVDDRSPIRYTLFVTFFPHLIAGPILHHREIMPQFRDRETVRFKFSNMSVGLFIFICGLAKKVVIADHFGPFAEAGFANVGDLTIGRAWGAALAYSLQLYFDFSGYSDMAIGLAKMFGVNFPLNFNSPYKSTNIIDFWQRFHMTLTRYITLYIYNPIMLAITRRRAARGQPVGRAATRTIPGFLSTLAFPLFVTMGLAGIWHGAGFQYLIFGLLHGFYLSVKHAWRVLKQGNAGWAARVRPAEAVFSLPLTYLCVLVGEVFFRSRSTHDAVSVLSTMVHPVGRLGLAAFRVPDVVPIIAAFAFVLLAPNVYELLGDRYPSGLKFPKRSGWSLAWRPDPAWALGAAMLFVASVVMMQDTSTFLYFQF